MGYFTYAAARRSERNARAARREAQLLRWRYEEDTGRLADESGTAPFVLAALIVAVLWLVVVVVYAVILAVVKVSSLLVGWFRRRN
jgi:hypothetical protein